MSTARASWFRSSTMESGSVRGMKSEGHGLLSIRRRAERLGAALDIDSQPGRGTTVTLLLPLSGARRRPRPALIE